MKQSRFVSKNSQYSCTVSNAKTSDGFVQLSCIPGAQARAPRLGGLGNGDDRVVHAQTQQKPVQVQQTSRALVQTSCHDSYGHGKCEKVTKINKLPYIINKPGSYCLAKDFTWSQDKSLGVAITVLSPDVVLESGTNVLTLVYEYGVSRPIGILTETTASNFTLRNFNVVCEGRFNYYVFQQAIQINNPLTASDYVENITIENLSILGALDTALLIQQVNNLKVKDVKISSGSNAPFLGGSNSFGTLYSAGINNGQYSDIDIQNGECYNRSSFRDINLLSNNLLFERLNISAPGYIPLNFDNDTGIAFLLRGVDTVTIRDSNMYASDHTIFTSFGQVNKNILIENNSLTSSLYNNQSGSGAFFLTNTKGALIKNNQVLGNLVERGTDACSGIGLIGCEDITIEGNHVSGANSGISVSNLDTYFGPGEETLGLGACRDVIVRNNTVTNCDVGYTCNAPIELVNPDNLPYPSGGYPDGGSERILFCENKAVGCVVGYDTLGATTGYDAGSFGNTEFFPIPSIPDVIPGPPASAMEANAFRRKGRKYLDDFDLQ